MTVRANKPAFNIREKLKELTHSIGLKGRELMRAATVQEARDLVSAGRRNLIINGDMSVWQRGTSTLQLTSANGLLADRWRVNAVSATFDVDQSTDAPEGFPYSLKISPSATATLSSTQQSYVQQTIESQNLSFLKWGTNEPTPITISFWAKASDTSNKCLWLYMVDGTDHIARQFNCKQANTWEKFTFTFPGNPLGAPNFDDGAGMIVRIVLDAGDTYANGTLPENWASATGGRYGTLEPGFSESTSNEFYLTGFQLEAGKNATEFEHRSCGEELALCQRYFYKLDSGRVFATANGSNAAISGIVLPVTMRNTPTPTFYGSNSTSGNIRMFSSGSGSQVNYDTAANSTSTVGIPNGPGNFAFNFASFTPSFPAGYNGWIDLGTATNSLKIEFDAEL